MAAKIRRNDEVIVLTGSKNNKGKRGKVKTVLSTGKVIVEGINLVKKHQKPVPALNQEGGIVEKEAPINVSNVAIFNPSTGKADRVGFRFENGKKVRFYKSTNELIN
ncbi:50S ribosomal protein L24 [Orbaceae bacterium ESL0721]|nr:50S ribosomal protein L24 [Orbaceae bacterium ESL0721]